MQSHPAFRAEPAGLPSPFLTNTLHHSDENMPMVVFRRSSRWADFYGSISPPTTSSRGLSAGARPRLGRHGRRLGPARAAPHVLTRGLEDCIYDGFSANLRGVSYLLSELTPRLATRGVSSRDYFGCVLSDLRWVPRERRSPCRRRAAVRLESSGRFHIPGKYTPLRLRCGDATQALLR